MVDLKLPCIKVNQRIGFYLATIKAGTLVDNYKVDRWHRELNPDGYQRKEFEDKIEEYKNYLLNPELSKLNVNLIDQTILINVRGATEFKNGELNISGDLYVVDGQHRAGGLKEACKAEPSLREFDIPVVLLNVDSDIERARFFIINEKAKRVPTDLAERQLLRVHPEVAHLVRRKFEPELVRWGTRIVDKLNASSEVWAGRIAVRGAE